MVATSPYDRQKHPLQSAGCTLQLVAATDRRSQGGEAQRWPGKSLGGKVEMATGRDVRVLLSHPMARSHPCAGLQCVGAAAAAATSPCCEEGQQPPAWWLVWESSSHRTPAKQTGSCQHHIGSLARSCWVAGTQRENKRNTTKSNSITARGKSCFPPLLLGKACSLPPLFLSPSTIFAALTQTISERKDQRSSVNQFSPVFIFLPAPKNFPWVLPVST